MQELRFVLIIVGIVAIAGLLFHGLWTSKKDGKTKFADKPLGKMSVDDVEPPRAFQATEPTKSKPVRQEPDFSAPVEQPAEPQTETMTSQPNIDTTDELSFSANDTIVEAPKEPVSIEPTPSAAVYSDPVVAEPIEIPEPAFEQPAPQPQPVEVKKKKPEPEMEVLVLHVHCATDQPFVGTQLFDSMQQNGLVYGEMDIFHYHTNLSAAGAVLFSVANMMQPGTLKHDDPATYSTKGISFFMTLPGFGESDQNFKIMLQTAQQIADDLGGNVLDDSRNLMTPNRIDKYRRQIQHFKQLCEA